MKIAAKLMSGVLLYSWVVVGARGAGVAASPAELAEARRWAAAKLEGVRPAPAAEPALVVGDAARVAAFARARGLRESPGAAPAGSSAQVWLERDAGGATLALVAASDPAAVAALAGPLPHYGKQSWLVFSGARAVARGVWPGRPQAVTLE